MTSAAGRAAASHLRTSAGSRHQHESRQHIRALVSQATCRDGMQCEGDVLHWLHKQNICDASCKVRISSSASGGGRSLQASADIADEVELLAIPESYWFSEPAQVLCSHGHSLWACVQARPPAWIVLKVTCSSPAADPFDGKLPCAQARDGAHAAWTSFRTHLRLIASQSLQEAIHKRRTFAFREMMVYPGLAGWR